MTIPRIRTSAGDGSKLRAALGIAIATSMMVAAGGTLVTRAEETKAGELEIAVSGLESDRGLLVVALMNSAETFANDRQALRNDSVPVKDGKATVTFRGLPYGSYAVKTYHDENSNGKLDTNFVGYPTESFGFSNDAMGRFGPPSFDQAKFEITSKTQRIVVHSK